MFVQVVTAQVRPDQLSEIERLFRQTDAGERDQARGPWASWLLLDRNNCKCLVLTAWDSEADLLAGESQGWQTAARVARTFASTPTREMFEVTAAGGVQSHPGGQQSTA